MNDATKQADKTTWFTLDRLYFETGKSTLKASSAEQLKNIATILAAYPSMELKLGRYTDNSLDSAINMKISVERANIALGEIVGADAKRLPAEGYGAQFPICNANDTKECKAQNRRIDVRVSKK